MKNNTFENESYLLHSDSGVILRLYIQPGAKDCELCGLYGEPARLKIKIKSPPVDGKANKMVIDFVSSWLNIRKKYIEIIKGETSRQKDLYLAADFKTVFTQITNSL